MTLPFTLEQFLEVFSAYNRLVWPGALLLWVASVVAFILILRRHVRAPRFLGWLLVAHWIWSGAAYHLAFFRDINPAALYFGILFMVQAGLFAWWTLRAPLAAFVAAPTAWPRFGRLVMGLALLYPALTLAFGMRYPRMPTFGVPCPTVLFTIGALLVARSTAPRWLGLIPLAWTVVGGSAAFLLGMHADYALVVAGGLLLASMLFPRQTTRHPMVR